MSVRRKIVISTAIASFMMLFCYFITNMDWPISGEQQVMSFCDEYLDWRKNDKMNDSVLFVNVSYDLELTDKLGKSMNDKDTIGNTAIADRNKLYNLLCFFDSLENPPFILLDIFFEKGIKTPIDDKLFSLINRMPHILVPYGGDSKDTLEDKRLHNKAYIAEYYPTIFQSSFVKYPYYPNSIKSLPLVMYEDKYLCGGKLNDYCLFYTDNGYLARKSVVLNFECEPADSIIHNLGELVGPDNLFKDEPDLASRKYVVIGSFYERDMHNTYKKEKVSGTVILFNAYLALLHGQHILSYCIGALLFMMFFVYSYLILSRRTLCDIISNNLKPTKEWAKIIRASLLVICYWFGFPACLTVVCAFTYLAEGKTYDILITSVAIQLIKMIVDLYYKRIELKI